MPSAIGNTEIKLKQLIPPRPQATRGKPFPLNGSEDWFIYPHGKNVYLYNFKDQSLSKEYREHAYSVSVSKLSPSRTFVASGDQCGNLRIWAVDSLETKLELRALGGKINDLEWSEDEKYIAVCGEGRNQFANVVKVDGGASFGELTGPSKPCPSITLHSSTILLASDDKSLTIYRASPTFKFVRTLRDHDNFVQVVRFRGDGKVFASAGADGKVFIYKAEDNYSLINQIKAHDMGILAMEWIDENRLLTASSDKSLKLWSVLEGTLLCQSEVSEDWNFEKQICGIKVIGDNILVLRLDGSLEFRDKNRLKVSDDTKYLKGIGHSKGIVDIIIQREFDVLSSVSYDGNLKTWKRENFMFSCSNEMNFSCKNVQKLDEKSVAAAVSENKIIFMTGETFDFEDKIIGQGNDKILTSNGNIKSLESANVKTVENLNVKSKIEVATFGKDKLAIFTEDFTLKFYDPEVTSFDIPSKITAMAFNPSCTALATADDQRRIKVYKQQNGSEWIKQTSQWCNHSARIDTLLWLEDEMLLSAGVDGHILAWSLELDKIGPIKSIKSAHSSPINKLTKLGDGEFASAASDSCIKIWEV